MASPVTFKTACRVCRDRKVKCDKLLPCRNCTLAGNVCSFPPQIRTVRRPKRAGGSSTKTAAAVAPVSTVPAAAATVPPNDQDIASRLSRLEELLGSMAQGQGLSVQAAAASTTVTTARETPDMFNDDHGAGDDGWSPSSSVPSTMADLAGDGYWRRLEQECAGHVFFKTTPSPDPIPETCAPPPPPPTPPPPHAAEFPFAHGRVGGLPQPPPLPSPVQRRECWARYVENVDPLLKILHKPTVEGLMLRAEEVEGADGRMDAGLGAQGQNLGFRRTRAPEVALVHAVCLLAVISMSAAEVAERLQCERETMIRRCARRLEQALMAANFLDARDLTTMQALLLYLYYLKHQEDPRLYSLRGMTIFLAARLGLNRDGGRGRWGSRLTVELRRRLWWQLITLVDHPDDCSTDYAPPSVGADTRLPLNVNDSELGGPRNRYGRRYGHIRRVHLDGPGTDGGQYDGENDGENDGDNADNDDDDNIEDDDDNDDTFDNQNRRGFTESSFCLMQYEITRIFHRIRFERVHSVSQRSAMPMSDALGSTPPVDTAEERLYATRRRMESLYFQATATSSSAPASKPASSCTSASASANSSHLSKFAADAIAMILTKRRVLMHIAPDIRARNTQLSPTEHDQLFLLAIHVLELSRALQTAHSFQRWRWLNDTYFQWSVASFVVRDLVRRCDVAREPPSPATHRAWHVIDGILDSWPAATRNSPKAAALRSLIADATRARQEQLPVPTPLRFWSLVPQQPLAPPPSTQATYRLQRAHEAAALQVPAVNLEPVSEDAALSRACPPAWPSPSAAQSMALDDFLLLPENTVTDGSFALDFECIS